MTTNNYHYNRYKRVKESLDGQAYKGTSLEKLAGYFIADLVFNFPNKNIYEKIKTLVKYALFTPRLNKLSSNKVALYGWSIRRSDYENLAFSYKKKLGWDFEDICLGGPEAGWKLNFDFTALKKACLITTKLNKLSYKDKLIIFTSIYTSVMFFNVLSDKFEVKKLKYT